MNTAHTPGPWHVEGNEIHASHTAVAVVCETVESADESNARLVAAAPELLAALRALIAMAERNVVPGFQDLRAASAVIAKVLQS